MRCVATIGLVLFVLAGEAWAGEYNAVLSIGDAAPAWTELPGIDGQVHSLSELPADQFVVVVFTCNSCPVARDYEERIIALAQKYRGKVSVVAINVNTIPEDSLDQMRSRAKDRKFNFPYLFDASQQIARDYGATGTPEFFLLSQAHIQASDTTPARKVVYMGAMDDTADAAQVSRTYLANAIDAALAGRSPPTAETFANGCRIRFERQRRK